MRDEVKKLCEEYNIKPNRWARTESELLELVADKIIVENRTYKEARHDDVLTKSQYRERTNPSTAQMNRAAGLEDDGDNRFYEVGASYLVPSENEDRDIDLLEAFIDSGRFWHSSLRWRGDEEPGYEPEITKEDIEQLLNPPVYKQRGAAKRQPDNCIYPGCFKKPQSRALCSLHFSQWKIYSGDNRCVDCDTKIGQRATRCKSCSAKFKQQQKKGA